MIMSSKRNSSISLVPGYITPEQRHQIIVDYLDRINKPTEVFHLRWKQGELLTGEVLESTPMFWYMKYQWSRQEIEGMFYAARCVIGPVFDQSLQQTYGGTAGPRWRGTADQVGDMESMKSPSRSPSLSFSSPRGDFQLVHSDVLSLNSIGDSIPITSHSININNREAESQAFLIEALREQNEKLSAQIKQRQVDHQQIVQNTINMKEIEMSDLRVEIEKLQEDNSRISELQSVNMELKQKLSMFDKIINSKGKSPVTSPFAGIRSPSSRPRGATVDAVSVPLPSPSMNSVVSTSISGLLSSSLLTPSFTPTITPSISPALSFLSASKSGRRSSILSLCSSESTEVDEQGVKAAAVERNNNNGGGMGKMEKFKRYLRMKKIGTPFMALIHKMRMDGMSQDDIDEFSGKSKPTPDTP